MRNYFTLLFIVLFASMGFSQAVIKKATEEKQLPKSYPVPAGEFERQQDLKVAQFLKDNPDYFQKKALQKITAWSFTVGDQKTWTSWDLTTTPEKTYLVPSTCQAVGTNCYVFVANDVWGKTVNAAAVDSVVNYWDNKTPNDPNKGIFQTDVDTFGSPPNVDGDPKIIILIQDIRDGYDSTIGGGYVAGFFNSSNEVGTNNAEMYYMDAYPTDLTTESGLNTALSTAAHEFQHMINWNYHKSTAEVTFVNEGLSMVAEIVCGFGASMQNLYANEPNHYFLDWRRNDNTAVLNDYARAQRYFLYLKEQYGTGILKQIVLDFTNYQLVGEPGLDKIFSQSHSTTFNDVFVNWEIANELNDRSVDTAYGYQLHGLPSSVSTTYGNPNISSSVSVVRQAASYISFNNGSNLSINFSGSGGNTIIKALEIGNNVPNRVQDVTLGTTFSEPAFGTTYKAIHFAIINTDQSNTSNVNFTSTGVLSNTVTELKWDSTEPTGFLDLPAGDTVCVVFNGVNGGVLDSVRVGLRQAGSIQGGVFLYNNNFSVTPLGRKLAGPFAASISTKPPVPYPVPWPNWVKIDLTSTNIYTNQPFAVAFVIPTKNNPEVMLTEKAGTDFAYSFTYETQPSKGSPRWLYYTSDNNTTYQYLIRAYVGYTVSGVKHEVVLTPKYFSLSQNYPNPFNPSTKIDFTLPASGKVRISVYNQLGQQVATLADGEYSAGAHEINFDGVNLASGVYYYRIVAGSFVQTKKMILLK